MRSGVVARVRIRQQFLCQALPQSQLRRLSIRLTWVSRASHNVTTIFVEHKELRGSLRLYECLGANAECGRETLLQGRERFELLREARDSGAAYRDEPVEESLEDASVSSIAHPDSMDKGCQEVCVDAKKTVHVELMIRLLMLLAERKPQRILERANTTLTTARLR